MSKSFRYSDNLKNPSPARKYSAPKPLRPSQKSKSSVNKPPLTSNTPNFGRPPNSRNPQDYKLEEESLDISEISKTEKKSQENLYTPYSNSYQNLPTCTFHPSIQSHLNKYDQALTLLTTNFQKYQSDTENHFQSLQDNLATIKNSAKLHSNFKENLEKFISKKTRQAGSVLLQEYSNICKEITNSDKFSKDNIEKLHQMQENYDQKLRENEDYLQSFDNSKSSSATRSKSSINHYFSSLAEENKRLRADLSKMWNRS